MTPFFIGRGTRDRWSGVGVARGCGDAPHDLVCTIAWLVREAGSVEAFIDAAVCEAGGWSSLLLRTPLAESSGAFPLVADEQIYAREFLGDSRGIFLSEGEGSQALVYFLDSSEQARVELRPDQQVQITWASGKVAVLERPPPLIGERDRRRRETPPVPVLRDAVPTSLRRPLRMALGSSALALQRAIVSTVEEMAGRAGVTEALYLTSAVEDRTFAHRRFGVTEVRVPLEPLGGPLFVLRTHASEGWSGRLGALMLTDSFTLRGRALSPDELLCAFRVAVDQLDPPAGASLEWLEERRGRATLVVTPSQGPPGRLLARAQVELLLWASTDPDMGR